MARIRPFQGWRYDLERTDDPGQMLVPPFDQIDAIEATRLISQHPHHAVQLIWASDQTRAAPVRDTGHPARWVGRSRRGPYEDAARQLRRWAEEGTLRQERQPAFYAYRQISGSTSSAATTTHLGFFAAVQLAPYGTSIQRHKRTHESRVLDRLALRRATRANLRPVIGLYADPAHTIRDHLRAAIDSSPGRSWTDAARCEHTFWVLRDPQILSSVAAAMAEKTIVIADGHDDYEAARRHRLELQEAGATGGEDDHVLMCLAAIEDRGTPLRPVHRLLHGLDGAAMTRLIEALGRVATMERVANAGALIDAVAGDASSDGVAGDRASLFGLISRSEAYLIRGVADRSGDPGDTTVTAESAADLCERLVLRDVLGWDLEEAVTGGRLTYAADRRRVLAAVLMGHYSGACILPPVAIDQVLAAARDDRPLPPKSTRFEPQVPTGLVFHRLDP